METQLSPLELRRRQRIEESCFKKVPPKKKRRCDLLDAKDHELPNGFTRSGRDMRGDHPRVLTASTQLEEFILEEIQSGKASAEGWSVALRLAADRIERRWLRDRERLLENTP